ncbi:uncharacterized protein G2W53_018955 [Senna tora]|uniref:Uncharacterized protein n=1 Tax=Senna tora TaxID=362788 RepID=A0A834TW78_9FABA|nr:uncharacterized protein G2W53_018955 [Senna tora]
MFTPKDVQSSDFRVFQEEEKETSDSSYLRYPHSIFLGQRFTLPCAGIMACGESSRNWNQSLKCSICSYSPTGSP